MRTLFRVAALLIVAGCGNGAGQGIPLGAILSVSGNKAQPGHGELLSVKLAVDEINSAGGVNGMPLVLDNRDDHSGVEGAKSAATDLITNLHASAIVGTTAPETTLAAAEETIAADVILISDIASGPGLNGLADRDTVFTTAPDRAVQGQILARRARERGFARAAVLYVDLPLHTETAEGFTRVFKAMGGTVTVNMKIPDDQKSYAAVLQQVYAAGAPDCILLNAEAPDGVQFVKDYLAAYAGQPTFFFFNPALANADFFEGVGYSNFTFHHEGIDVADGPGIEAYEAAHTAKWGPTEVLEPGIYDDVYLLALAMQAGGKFDAATIKANIRAIGAPTGTKIGPGEFARAVSILKSGGTINYEGASGSCDFDKDGSAQAANLLWEVHGTERVTTVPLVNP